MATITKTPSKTWKAIIRKCGWPTAIKTFRTKRDADDWAWYAPNALNPDFWLDWVVEI